MADESAVRDAVSSDRLRRAHLLALAVPCLVLVLLAFAVSPLPPDPFADLAAEVGVASQILTALLHTLFAWTLAGMVLALALFAAAHWQRTRTAESAVVACFLCSVALLDGLAAIAVWIPTPDSAAAATTTLFAGSLSRHIFAFACLSAPWAISTIHANPKSQPGILAGIAALGGGAVAWATAGIIGFEVPQIAFPVAGLGRPFALIPLILFATAGLGAFARSYRHVSPLFNRALIASTVPQMMSQLAAALGGPALYDAYNLTAEAQRGLAYTYLLAILVIHVSRREVRQQATLSQMRQAERQLRTRTQELFDTARERDEEAHNRERAEQTLRTLEKAVETMRLGVTITNLEGRIIYVNPAEAAMHGFTVDEVLHREARIFGPPETHRPIAPSALGAWARETVNVTRDGRVFPVRLVSDLVHNTNDEPVARVTISEDITERQRIDRMKQEFIETVSHELRTPLTSIIAALGLLRGNRLAQDRQRREELLDIATRNSKRLLHIINDLLDLQKLAAGKMEINSEGITIHRFLREALRDIDAIARDHGVDLVLRDPGEGRVLADRMRLTQVIENLLSNAIHASPEHAQVVVAAAIEAELVVISVADRGPGIPPAFQDRIFDRFVQADATERRQVGGSGLGLSLVKGMVEAMNGTVHFDTGPRQGTTFYVTLPRALGHHGSEAS